MKKVRCCMAIVVILIIVLMMGCGPKAPTITTTVGYPQLLVGGEYYYLVDVEEDRIPLPFQQIELNGIKSYLISDKHQIISDGTIWDWEKAKDFRR